MGNTLNILPVTTLDYRRLAEKRLPRFLFDYIDGGANDEITLRNNVGDFQNVRIKQHVMRDVSRIDTSTTLAGESAAMPLVLAPVGGAGLYARRGEVQAVRAADAAGVPFTLSTVGVCPLEEIHAAAKKPFWFQLYMIRDRAAVQKLLERAMANGCSTLVFTVDLAVLGMRHRDARNGMLSNALKGKLGRAWQLGTRPGWIYNVGLRGRPLGFGSMASLAPDANNLKAIGAWLERQRDSSVTWKDIEWLRSVWRGKLLIKGILEPDDASAALNSGADGVVVSNHGARQLDSVASTISKLPAVVDAVRGRMEIYVDGGVRGGLDVFKAVALGAKGVMIGRPWAWAIAAGGEAALTNLLATFKKELEVAMALAGVNQISEIGRDLID